MPLPTLRSTVRPFTLRLLLLLVLLVLLVLPASLLPFHVLGWTRFPCGVSFVLDEFSSFSAFVSVFLGKPFSVGRSVGLRGDLSRSGIIC